MYNNDRMTATTRKIHASPQEPLAPAMNLKTVPGLLMCINFCGVIYFLFMTVLIVAVSFSITLSALYTGAAYWLRIFVALFILFQIFGNFLLVWHCNSFCNRMSSDTLPGSDWRHCVECQIAVPPRSHHCPLCRHCIAVRDHHCFFTASCVGHDNRRHFIAFCFNCAAGTAYATQVAFTYASLFHGDGGYTYLLLPIAAVRWILGWQTGSSILSVCFIYICFTLFLGSSVVSIWELFLVMRGQTVYEFYKGKWNPWSFTPKTVMRNIRAVFGPYWPVVFFCPWPIFPIYCDNTYLKSI